MRSLINNPGAWIGSLLAAITLASAGCATINTAINPYRLVLVQDGQPRTVVVLPEDPEKLEQMAADELAHFLEKMSGAKIPIKKAGEAAPDAQTVRILIGTAAKGVISANDLDRAEGHRRDDLNCRDGFVIRTKNNVVAIRGVRSTGTLFGAYEFLEQLGCRWFWPGTLGEFVPQADTITLNRPINTVQVPTFDMRTMWFSGDLAVHNFAHQWVHRMRLSLDYQYSGGHRPHPDISKPDASEIMATRILEELEHKPNIKRVSLSWSDTSARSIGDKALGLRHPWNKNQEHATDALVEYYNGVVERVEAKHPNLLYTFLVYNNYFLQAIRHKPHPNLSPWFTPIEQCTRHLPGSGRCWQRDANFEILKTWCEMSDKVFIYDYEPALLIENGLPMPSTRRFAIETPIMAQYGVRGIYQQSQLTIMNQGPNLYVRAKQMWDAHTDVAAILDDYYAKMFGPAGPHVRRYRDALEQMLYHAPGHQQHAYYFEDELLKMIYPIDEVRKLEHNVRDAEASAETPLQRRRVQAVRFSFDNLMLYLRMRDAEDEGRFTDAANLADEIHALRKRIDQVDLVLYKIGDLDRNDEGDKHGHMPGGWAKFNRARAANINGSAGELVAMTPKAWSFSVDPRREGITDRWFEADHDTSQWKPIHTTLFWEVQGYESQDGQGHDGVGWYQTKLRVPQRFEGRTIKLNFGGVAGEVLVWVDGQFAGYQPYPRPWWFNRVKQNYDIDVTNAVTAGEDNTITVRVRCDDNWGGIFRRIFLWTPN